MPSIHHKHPATRQMVTVGRIRSDTRPDTPGAMRVEVKDSNRAMLHEAPMPTGPVEPALEKERR
jgi:hypothetical protein